MRRALLLVLGCCAAFASAAEAPAIPAGMQRMGEGSLRWFGLTVYRAQPWSAARPVDFSHPFALSLRYARARFFHNGRPLGQIDDPKFARAFFSIWLDPRTSAPGLRAELLGAR